MYVSGGPDSMCLLHMVLSLFSNYKEGFGVLHVNHHLRGQESDAEQAFVQNWCENNGIRCHIKDFHWSNQGNLQNEARKKRYQFGFELQEKWGYNLILTAHHSDDELETLIMRKARGASIFGFSGIRPMQELKSKRPGQGQLSLLRPLLDFTKKEIISYLKGYKLSFCKDSSNEQIKYFRNRVRSKVQGSELSEDLRNDVKLLQKCTQYLDLRAEYFHQNYHQLFSLKLWNQLSSDIQFRYLKKQFKKKCSSFHLEEKHLQQINETESQLEMNRWVILKDTENMLWLDKNWYQNRKEWDYQFSKESFVKIGALPFVFEQKIGVEKNSEELLQYLKSKQEAFPRVLYLDADKVPRHFHYRFCPLSLKMPIFGKVQEKPLKKIFSEKKVPLAFRSVLPVAFDSLGEVLFVPGVEVNPNYGVSKGTSRILKVCLKHN